MLIDTHCHLNDARFSEDFDTVATGLKKEGLKFVVCNSFDRPSSEKAIALTEKYDTIYATIGIHPHDSKDFCDDDSEFLKITAKHPRVVAIGEIGLDYHYDLSPRDVQREAFVRQIKIAHEAKLPVVFHLREAKMDFLKILEDNKQFLVCGGVAHSFGEDIETAKKLIDMGFYLGINGTVTFKNFKKTDVIKALPLDKLLLETDCPYLSPEPFRGQRNEPKNVKYVAEAIARIKGIKVEEVIEQTGNNVLKVFDKITVS